MEYTLLACLICCVVAIYVAIHLSFIAKNLKRDFLELKTDKLKKQYKGTKFLMFLFILFALILLSIVLYNYFFVYS